LKDCKTEQIRNIAIIGQGSSGKTSLAEAMLYSAGVTSRLGRVDDGTTASDFQKDEIERKFSIGLSLLNCEWNKHKLNIVDTPGYADFVADAKAALRVVDSALVVVDGTSGIEVGTEVVWGFAEAENVPRAVVVNMLDKEHTNFDKVLEEASESLSGNLALMQFPVNAGLEFSSVIDVLAKKMLTFTPGGKGEMKAEDIPADYADKAEELYEQLMERVAESDDALLEKFFEEGALSDEELRKGVTSAMMNGSMVPVFATAAFSNIGVSSLMDFLTTYAPAPTMRGSFKGLDGERKISADEPVSAFIFKTLSEGHLGELSLMRVMSGTLESGSELINPRCSEKERVGQVYSLCGNKRTEEAQAVTGDLVSLVKLKKSRTGDTLCDAKARIEYPAVEFPNPVITVAIEAKTRGEEEKISAGLTQLNSEDPTFSVKQDQELRQMTISGQGELHLTVITDRLKKKYGVEVVQKEPKVPYRETISGKGESKYRHKKQSGGAGQFAEVWMRVGPKSRGEGIEFKESLVGQNVDRVFVPSVEKGVVSACTEGVYAGYPVVDVQVDFYDGKMHPVDSKDVAFQIAGRGAFKESFLAAKPTLLEPIYTVEVTVPEEYMGDVMGDVSTRRGKVLGMEASGNKQVVKAQVPLAEMYRYSTSLRSMTQGRGIYTMGFSHYEQVPNEIQGRLVDEYKKSREEGNK
jgi:elongation factor G